MKKGIHPTAIIEGGARIEAGVEVGPYCVVGPGTTLGEGTRLLSHVSIQGTTRLGKENVVHPFTVIGSAPQDLVDPGGDTETVIGDRNVIRETVTINRGSNKGGARTVIGSDNYLMAISHVGHDCVLGSRIILVNSALLGGHVEIEDDAYVSGNTSVHQFVTVGRHAFLGASSKIPRDAPPFMLVQGEDHEVICVNTVGLKRRGFKQDVINALEEAHRVIWRSGLSQTDALSSLKKTFNGHYSEVDYLISFMQRSAQGKNGRARETLRNIPVPGKA